MPETLAKKFAVNVLTPDAFKSIPKGSGNLLSTFDFSAPKIDSTNVVCASQGGVTISYSNSMEDTLADIDNAPTNTKQGNEVTGTTATIAFTTPNASPDVLKLAIGTADIDADDPTMWSPASRLPEGLQGAVLGWPYDRRRLSGLQNFQRPFFRRPEPQDGSPRRRLHADHPHRLR